MADPSASSTLHWKCGRSGEGREVLGMIILQETNEVVNSTTKVSKQKKQKLVLYLPAFVQFLVEKDVSILFLQ